MHDDVFLNYAICLWNQSPNKKGILVECSFKIANEMQSFYVVLALLEYIFTKCAASLTISDNYFLKEDNIRVECMSVIFIQMKFLLV